MSDPTFVPTRRHMVLAGAAMLALAGCGSLLGPSSPPLQLYRLRPAFPAAGGPFVSWQLAVARPSAPQSLDTERIALMRGALMDYYADAQWSDSVPRLVQSLLVEAFERSGRILAVAAESGGVHGDYTLECEIRDFDAQYATDNGAPTVIVAIEAKLLGPQGKVVASLEAKQAEPASANSVPSVVAAFDQAIAATLTQIVTWALGAPPPK
ncbi:MAG TPA: ABC-type transport auxiliary lipoprotein family protein [Rhizomicrobium sp.]|jgi:cholesterol transport system auxiliary component|nr:ABC-type transport auxiliary lipoprotein family protein [Rhizomicrobium sp.]